MSQLALFDTLPPQAIPVVRAKQSTPRRQDATVRTAAIWMVGMLARLPITAGIEGEKWRQYTMGLSGRVEVIEGDMAGVRIESPGHRFDGKLAVASLAGLGRGVGV